MEVIKALHLWAHLDTFNYKFGITGKGGSDGDALFL